MKQSVDQSLRKAASLSAKGNMAEAEAIYRNVLERFPTNKRALDGIRSLSVPRDSKAYDRGLDAVLGFYEQGRLRETLDHVRLLIDLYPSQPDLHNIAGAAFAGTGQFDCAVEAYDQAIALKPDYAEVHSNRATALTGLQRHGEALASCDVAIRLLPDNAQAHSNRGIALKHLGRLDEAVASYDVALRLMPKSAEAHYNRANALLALKRFEEAVAGYDRAIDLQPTYIVALSNRGNALKAIDKLDDALDSYRRALALHPDFAEAHSNLGIVLLGLKRIDEALASCRTAIELQPALGEAHYNLAIVLAEMQRLDEALAAYDRAVALDPAHGEAHVNRGNVLFELHKFEEAEAAYRRALSVAENDDTAHYSLGNVLQAVGRLDEAAAGYRRAIAINPEHVQAVAQLVYQQARMCEWSSGEKPDLSALGVVGKAISPYSLLVLEDTPQTNLLRARTYAAEKHPVADIVDHPAPAHSGPIRIGYFSADFHDHAVMFQLARMFELHDRARFTVHAYSYGLPRPSAMRARLERTFDAFHDVSAMDSRDIAALARREGLDIAIDLMGYTGHARPDILALRPAPVQIAYMGYPGTMGAPFIDYLIADDVLIPTDQRAHYAEKIIYLPETYQANDDTRVIADRAMTRADLGLPEQGFVFCCFNNSFKIGAAEFDVWMRLLAKVEGSVLWLLQANRWVEENLRREAAARGINPERLLFAGRMEHKDHLARLKLADLFLDCFTCNAHATASDALWAGVPVLTVPGEGFAARVGASVLKAIGLPDLVANSREDYERIALELAKNPARHGELKARVAANRKPMPLFDSARFTQHIEMGYELAVARQRNGMGPDHIAVPRLPI